MTKEALFAGVFPTGISYCDRTREKDGDYLKLAFLSFHTLDLIFIGDRCSAALRATIEANAAVIQARQGQQYPVSSSGQTVTLGRGVA